MLKLIITKFFAKFINWKLNFSLSILAFLVFVSSGQIFGPYFFFGFGKWFSLGFLLIYLILPIFHFQKLSQKSTLQTELQSELQTEIVKNENNLGDQNNLANQKIKLTNYQNLVQFWLISIVFFAYFGRMNGFGLNILGFNLSSFWLFLPFLIFIFAINYFLFKSRRIPEFLLTIFVFITTLLNFSFVEFLQNDRTNKRFFVDNSIDFIFSLPIWIWFVISILTIFATTLINLNVQIKLDFKDFRFASFWKRFLKILVVIAISFVSSYNLPLLYWYKSLIFLIIWHFLFQLNLTKFQEKTKTQSLQVFGYHFLLTIIVFLFGFWLI